MRGFEDSALKAIKLKKECILVEIAPVFTLDENKNEKYYPDYIQIFAFGSKGYFYPTNGFSGKIINQTNPS
ncbi:hypothetical protein MalM14_30360 [Gimesia chilikensis]|nr:hypothetical protein MalM14_30360 [Gimesia chilikensis]